MSLTTPGHHPFHQTQWVIWTISINCWREMNFLIESSHSFIYYNLMADLQNITKTKSHKDDLLRAAWPHIKTDHLIKTIFTTLTLYEWRPYVPMSTISGANAIFSFTSFSGVVTDLSSGVKTLLPPNGGTREGNANVEFWTWLVDKDLRRTSLSGVLGGEILRWYVRTGLESRWRR